MTRGRVTEAEVVDVLMGGAEAELEARVLEQARTDPAVAKMYEQWAATIPGLKDSVVPSREMADRVVAGVMNAIEKDSMGVPVEEPEFAGLWESEVEKPALWRRPRWMALGSVAAAAMVALGLMWMMQASPRTVYTVVEASGENLRIDDQPFPALSNDRLSAPVKLEVGDGSSLTLEDGEGGNVLALASGSVASLSRDGSIRQIGGKGRYLAVSDSKILVEVPHGKVRIVDGETEVSIEHKTLARIRVISGSAYATNPKGDEGSISAGQQAWILPTGITVGPIPVESESGAGSGDMIALEVAPRGEVFDPASNLAAFVQPERFQLGSSKENKAGMRLPPFTSPAPFTGWVTVRDGDDSMELFAAADRKLDDRWRIYLDANGNNDLTDDPVFTEGEDFVAGSTFAAGETKSGSGIWLSGVKDDEANVIAGLDYFNFNMLSAEVEIPGAGGAPVPYRLVLLDRDSDGDYTDDEGGLTIWTDRPRDGRNFPIHSMGYFGQSLLHRGWRWSLNRPASGDGLRLEGRRAVRAAEGLRLGDLLPPVELRTIEGESLTLGPPEHGYLLVYFWASWQTGAVPGETNKLFQLCEDFYPRGLNVVAVSTDFRKVDLLNFLKSSGTKTPQVYHGPNLYEGLPALLAIESTPSAVLVDPRGVILQSGSDFDTMREFLEKNLTK